MMRINPQFAAQPLVESERSSAQSAANAANRPALGEDQAQFSSAHAQVDALAAQAAQLPEIRQARVESLREVVRSGGYRIDPSHVAGAILNHMVLGPAA